MSVQPAVCDYEGSAYRTEFWGGQGRAYEDLTERLALHRLLPRQGQRLIEIGAGFGRMANEYQGYDEIILVDYSRSLLQEARTRLSGQHNIRYVAANIYQLPFLDQVADTLVMMRVMHHLADVPTALAQLSRITKGGGVAILEYANKRNIKALMRYVLGRQNWSPFDPKPYEYVPLNFDFQPSWMKSQMKRAQFQIKQQLAVSHFRLGGLKRRVSAETLAAWDAKLFHIAAPLYLAPSIWVQATVDKPPQPATALFACPRCATSLPEVGDSIKCPTCGTTWLLRDGIYDFKQPVT